MINDDDIYTNNSDVSLSITANDLGSNVAQMSFSFDNKTWTGWENYNDTRSLTLPDGDGDKKVYFRTNDIVRNIAMPVFDSITLDTSPPESLQILINDGVAQTDSTDVTLSLSAVDRTSGVQLMAFSNDGTEWTNWEDFSSNKSYTLPLLVALLS